MFSHLCYSLGDLREMDFNVGLNYENKFIRPKYRGNLLRIELSDWRCINPS